MRIPARLMPHKRLVSYKPKLGDGTYGPVYGEEVVCARAAIEDTHKLVRSRDGAEVVSSTQVVLDPEHHVPEGSLVTVWRGRPRQRTATLISEGYAEFPQLPAHTFLALE